MTRASIHVGTVITVIRVYVWEILLRLRAKKTKMLECYIFQYLYLNINVDMEITIDATEINDPQPFFSVNVIFNPFYVTVCLITYFILSYIFFRAEV